MDEKAKSLVIKLTNAAYEAGMWKDNPNKTMAPFWREKAEEIGDEIVRRLTSQSSQPREVCTCPNPKILEKSYCTECGRDMHPAPTKGG